MVKVVKSIAAAGAFTCLLLALSACRQDSGAKSAPDTTEQDKTLRIAAAANLSDVLPSIVDSYQADNSVSGQDALDIDVTYASSGKLYAQIRAGAPYDIFLSANQEFPAKLADESIANKASESVRPFTYTRGQLALYSVTEPLSSITPTALSEVFSIANFTSNGKIAIANPDLAPYGAAAKAYLQSQKMYDTLSAKKRLIQAENDHGRYLSYLVSFVLIAALSPLINTNLTTSNWSDEYHAIAIIYVICPLSKVVVYSDA